MNRKKPFKPNKQFRRDYNLIYRTDPEAANMFLLLAELADSNGRIVANDEELADLFYVRFNNPEEYSL